MILMKVLSALLLLTCVVSLYLYKHKKIDKLETVAINSTFIIFSVGIASLIGILLI